MKAKSVGGYYHKKRVVVTGGLGFIGSSLVRKLVADGANVTIIDSLISGYGGNVFNIHGLEKKVEVNISDIRDRDKLNEPLSDKDFLFNLAGTLSHVDSMEDPFTDLEINVTGQVSILEACRKYNPNIKIVYSGTRNQYGKAQYLPVDENHPQNPIDVNGINCVAGEYYHLLYSKVYGIKACSLRLTNTYGPRHQMKHPRQGVLNWFIRKIIDGEEVELYGTGKQVRDVSYIDDVVEALLLAGASEKVWGEVYNLGGIPVSLKDFVTEIIKVNKGGKCHEVEFPDNRKKIEIGDYIADYSKFTKTTGWKPKVTLDTGILKTLNYYKKYKKHYW